MVNVYTQRGSNWVAGTVCVINGVYVYGSPPNVAWNGSTGGDASTTCLVPSGATYALIPNSGSQTLLAWAELR